MTLAEAVLAAARATVGWREDPPGSNDSPAIRSWLAQVGVHRPEPWCAAWTHAMYRAAAESLGVPNPHPATTGSLRLWGLCGEEVRRRIPTDAAVAVFAHVGDDGHRDGRGHVALVEAVLPDGLVRTIEGNTNAEGSRNGDRVAEHEWNWIAGRRGRLELLGFLDLAAGQAPAVS